MFKQESTELKYKSINSEVVLYAKDKFSLSDSTNHKLSTISHHLTCSCQLKALAREIRIKGLLKEGKLKKESMQVELTGDGTKICRKLSLIQFCFTELNEGDLTKSPG